MRTYFIDSFFPNILISILSTGGIDEFEEKIRKEEAEKKAKEAEEKKKRLEEAEAKRQQMLEAQKG